MARRLVVVGADAAGMSAAAQARRLTGREEMEITAFERGHFSSYSACGIPYWVGGQVADRDRLIARTPEEHRARGIDLRMSTEVTAIDLDRRAVRVRPVGGGPGEIDGPLPGAAGEERWEPFDLLVVATGAEPVRPALPGFDAPGVHGLQTLDDGAALLRTLDRGSALRAVVVGGGYIGIETAEAMVRRGLSVTVLDRGEEPMSTLDPDMGRLVREAMQGMGIEVHTGPGAEVRAVRLGEDGRPRAVVTADAEHPADVVVLGLGVRPRAELARAAGMPIGEHGGILTDARMRVRGLEGVWAGGDCVEVYDLVAGGYRHVPLGTHANKQGQVIGSGVGGQRAAFPGVVGTAVSKVCELEIARTGLREKEIRAAGLPYVSVVVESTGRAGYYPGAEPMTVKMHAETGTGRLLGVQVVGREGAAKRVDAAAVALTARMTVDQVAMLDLGYAPPFSPVWDPIQVAARKAATAV